MRDLHELDQWRRTDPDVWSSYGSTGDGTCGAFNMPSPVDGGRLLIVASSEAGWDHVSVSREKRAPNWREMDFVKRKFFKDDEVAVQFHVATLDHINIHPHCLHLWRSQKEPFPQPPKIVV